MLSRTQGTGGSARQGETLERLLCSGGHGLVIFHHCNHHHHNCHHHHHQKRRVSLSPSSEIYCASLENCTCPSVLNWLNFGYLSNFSQHVITFPYHDRHVTIWWFIFQPLRNWKSLNPTEIDYLLLICTFFQCLIHNDKDLVCLCFIYKCAIQDRAITIITSHHQKKRKVSLIPSSEIYSASLCQPLLILLARDDI